MENTLENKAKFFAQYWGQRVFNNGLMGDDTGWDFTGSNHDEIDGGYFTILRPLSSITDEDADYLARIYQGSLLPWNKSYSEAGEGIVKAYLDDSHLSTDCYDYLRSKGYALPYMGLTVETLVEYGWVKLI